MAHSRVSAFSTAPNLKRVGTHNGNFHCDEALGCFMIRLTDKFRDAQIVRTRDQQVWNLKPIKANSLRKGLWVLRAEKCEACLLILVVFFGIWKFAEAINREVSLFLSLVYIAEDEFLVFCIPCKDTSCV